MNIKHTLEQLKLITAALDDKKDDMEKARHYSTAFVLIELLRKFNAQEHNSYAYVFEKLAVLDRSLLALSGLGKTGGHTADQHRIWANQAIENLSSESCLKQLLSQH